MPRQLPWKAGASKTPLDRRRSSSPASSTAQTPAPVDRSATWSTTTRLKSETPNPSTPNPRRSLAVKLDRSPSTSPPLEPPTEEFMIEGISHDDRYRMVEDEFFAIASNFTKHLHAAEYHRLKALASTRNAEMIRTISRPVTGQMTDMVKKRQHTVKLAASQRRGLMKALGKRKGTGGPLDSDNDDELPWAGTSLQGLMDSPRKKKIPLSIIAGVTASTRAAAGFHDNSRGTSSRAPNTTGQVTSRPAPNAKLYNSRGERFGLGSDSDSDGLDAQPTLPDSYKMQRHGTGRPVPVCHASTRPGTLASRQEPHYLSRPLETSTLGQDTRPMLEPISDQAYESLVDDGDDNDDFMSRIRNRRAQQRRRREPTSGSEDKTEKRGGRSSLDAIPLF